jgi:hypothetical protein
MTTYSKTFRYFRLPSPRTAPDTWRTYLNQYWSMSREWARPPLTPLADLRGLMQRDMPELLPDFDALAGALPEWGPAGLQALANWNLVPFFQGCSVTRSLASGRPTLLRNYDLGIDDTAGIFHLETLPDGHWLLGSAEAGWGYLDGVNSRGLAATITFGGRFTAADGWSIPILMRYILATCSTVDEGAAFLKRVPHRLAQNFLLVDKHGGSNVVYASGDLGVTVVEGGTACTNHQDKVYVPDHAAFVRTVERLAYMQQAAGALTLADMLRPPLYNTQYQHHFGTLYSAEYDPTLGTARYAWPGQELLLTPDSPEAELTVELTEA